MVKTLDKDLFSQAKLYLSGGVNSPVRSFRAVGGYPVFVKEAKGSKIYSECDREFTPPLRAGAGFIDYCLSWGALILGHAHPEVVEALKKAVEKGTAFGAPTELETQVAKIISQAIPTIEKIRFTNSGTEAVMTAVRIARAYTQKDKIIKFIGSYHGHADYLLDCPGIPKSFQEHTLTTPYNDLAKVESLVEKYKDDIAAIIVEPVAANMGVVLPKEGFLAGLRKLSERYNLVLIFDEVITGFRLAFGGAQELLQIKPDLTCLGKIIGGGLPVGAVGGKREIMRLLAPEGEVYQAGTFSGNPLTTSAGLATLKVLARDNPYPRLEKLTRKLCENINSSAKDYGVKVKVNYLGSIFTLFFTDKEVVDYDSAKQQNKDLFKRFYQGLLKKGIYFSPSGFEANFISTAHTAPDIEETLKAISKIFKQLKGE